jgi:antirestriction protein ArdC
LDAAIQWDRDPKPAGIPLLRPVIVPEKVNGTIQYNTKGKAKTHLIGFAGFTAYRETDQVGWNAPVVATLDFSPIEVAEQLVKDCGVKLIHGGDKAMHVDSEQTVYMPVPERFDTVLEYYRTLMHEIVHWTSNAARCNRREENRKKHSSNAYAFEELIAEIGSTFLCSELGLGQEEQYRTNHIKYIKGWMDMMRSDSGIIVSAASKAEDAVNYLMKRGKYATKVKAAA